MPKPHALVLALLLTGLPLTQAIAQSAPEAELLAPQQTLDIRVGRWDPVEETYSSWDTVGGSYIVSTTGTVTLPLVGQIDTTGLSPDQLGNLISDRAQSALGLRGDVQAAVSIAAYAPIYVLGDVGAPGAYPFTPDMTVLQALSLAGGVDRANPALVRGERGALTALGSYRVMELDLLRRLATLARLEAQEAERDIIAPAELADAPLGQALLAQEERILQSERQALASSLAQLDELEVLLQERIARLDTQSALRQQQLDLLEEELGAAASLVERGLSTAARESNLQRQVADQQVRLLEVETAQLNAQQQLNETRRDRLDLVNARARDRLQGLQDQRRAIGELRIRMQTEAALFSESVNLGTGLVALSSLEPPEMQITRRTADGTETIDVDRLDQVQAGDVLEVLLAPLEQQEGLPMQQLSPTLDGLSLPVLPLDGTRQTLDPQPASDEG
ncbi:MAG: polysaccharide biosynthesis/export family protein [Pseudomonadota bacterium]